MADDTRSGPTEGPSRRQVLRRVGAGAAVAWAAPVVTTMDRAYAVPSPPGGGGNDTCPDGVLSGARDDVNETIGVDDDWTVYLNGSPVLVDNDQNASEHAPVHLGPISDGDLIRIVAKNRDCCAGDHCGMDPVFLHCPATGFVAQLATSISRTCDAGEVFRDETYSVDV